MIKVPLFLLVVEVKHYFHTKLEKEVELASDYVRKQRSTLKSLQ